MGNFGIATLLPPGIVLFIAIKYKRPIEALFFGAISAYLVIGISTQTNAITLATDSFFKVATDYDNVWLIMVCGLFGSLIALLNVSKGTIAIARAISRICKTTKSVLLAAWGLGIAIFIDDYMNIMTISSCMKKLCDKLKIPRTMLAYVINSTGAPTCVLVPFSTWAVFFAASFYEQSAIKNLGYGTAMETYMHAIPFMFYALFALLLVPLVICGFIPIMGKMKSEYIASDYVMKQKEREVDLTSGKVIDFILPIGAMIGVTIAIGNLFIALIVALLVCVFLYLPRKVISIDKFCDLWIKGFGDLVPTLAIMLFAFYMKQACADINLPVFILSYASKYVSTKSFPALAFLLVSALAFITGDNWGVPAICVPIIIPLGAACHANMLLVMGAVVSGGVFCSHACFYSDATVLTATCCEIDNMSHSVTQLPYALLSFSLSFVMYILVGFIL